MRESKQHNVTAPVVRGFGAGGVGVLIHQANVYLVYPHSSQGSLPSGSLPRSEPIWMECSFVFPECPALPMPCLGT